MITQSNREFYNKHKDEYTHILSIVCPDEKELINPIHENHYIVEMWDIDKPLKNKFREYLPPSENDFFDTIFLIVGDWLLSYKRNEDFRLLIHCDMGASRSPAITLGILWAISSHIFGNETNDDILRVYLEARKQWCKSLLDWNNSNALCRYIDGRYNPGVKPNQAILEHFRTEYMYFPW